MVAGKRALLRRRAMNYHGGVGPLLRRFPAHFSHGPRMRRLIDLPPRAHLACALSLSLFVVAPRGATAAEATAPAAEGWIELAGDVSSSDWRDERRGWSTAGDAQLDPDNDRRLSPVDGSGVLLGAGGENTANLKTMREFQDIAVRLEFMVPSGSNSGVKLNGLYEIQIRDSYGKEELTADDLGGVYPRAELRPTYTLLDDGVPARVNAARPIGEWQTLELEFVSPRFGGDGKKVENARFLRVVLNGQVIHENVELLCPTGHAWDEEEETPQGPLFLQGDHGPVAFRKIAVRPLGER
jgi:hypothetical protein